MLTSNCFPSLNLSHVQPKHSSWTPPFFFSAPKPTPYSADLCLAGYKMLTFRIMAVLMAGQSVNPRYSNCWPSLMTSNMSAVGWRKKKKNKSLKNPFHRLFSKWPGRSVIGNDNQSLKNSSTSSPKKNQLSQCFSNRSTLPPRSPLVRPGKKGVFFNEGDETYRRRNLRRTLAWIQWAPSHQSPRATWEVASGLLPTPSLQRKETEILEGDVGGKLKILPKGLKVKRLTARWFCRG